MNRRGFIKVFGTGAIIAAALPTVGCSSDSSSPTKWRPTHEYDDIRKTLISYAMLCPNPHNKQPWTVSFVADDTILLYVDQTRLLPETDPVHRQIHIGQGTFIESLVVSASNFGILANIEYFPQGEYNNQSIEFKPVAAIRLQKSTNVQADPLFAQLLTRQSSKGEYESTQLNSTKTQAIADIASADDFSYRMVDKPEQRKQMADMLTKAMAIEEQNKARSLETIAMFRFNDEEFAKYRDGFGLPQNGVKCISISFSILCINFNHCKCTDSHSSACPA